MDGWVDMGLRRNVSTIEFMAEKWIILERVRQGTLGLSDEQPPRILAPLRQLHIRPLKQKTDSSSLRLRGPQHTGVNMKHPKHFFKSPSRGFHRGKALASCTAARSS